MDFEPGAIVDRYEVVRFLSRGGCATVYLCRHRSLDSKHAMKFIAGTDQRTLDAVLAEGRMQARVRHPNVVMISDMVSAPGGLGLVMEFIEGCPLSDVIGGGEPMLRGDVARFFREISGGISAAHREGILHRDIKPGNVMLDVSAGTVRARIMDFGIARALQAAGPSQDQKRFVGTPGYMAPEQLTDPVGVDARADVFALGCLLYEMCCGVSPFLRPEVGASVRATLKGEHVPLQERDRTLPEILCRVVERALSVQPGERYGSVQDFALACEAGFSEIADKPSSGIIASIPRGTRARGGVDWGVSAPTPISFVERRRATPPPAQRIRTLAPPVPTAPPRRSNVGAYVGAAALVLLVSVPVGASKAALSRLHTLDMTAQAEVGGLDTLWEDGSGPIAALYTHTTDRSILRGVIAEVRASETPEARIDANRRLVDVLASEAVHQRVDRARPGADERGEAAEQALQEAAARVEAASAAWDAAADAREGFVGLLSVPAGWMDAAQAASPELVLSPPSLAAFGEPAR